MNQNPRPKVQLKSGVFHAQVNSPISLATKVTIENNQIIDVDLHTLKSEPAIEPALVKEFKGQIIAAQSINIDGISSASILTKAVRSVVGLALAESHDE